MEVLVDPLGQMDFLEDRRRFLIVSSKNDNFTNILHGSEKCKVRAYEARVEQ